METASAIDPELRGPLRRRPPALRLDLVPHRAAREVVVDEPAGLHQRVGGRRPDEAKAAPLQLPGQRRGLGGRRRDVVVGAWRPLAGVGAKGPDQLRQRLACPREARRAARAFAIAASILARLRTIPSSASSRFTSPSPKAATRSISKSAKRPGTPRACEGSSATRGRTGTPPGRGAHTGLGRRAPGGPTRRRGSRRTRAPRLPTGSAAVRRPRLSESQRQLSDRPRSSTPAARRASARSAKGRQRTIRPSREGEQRRHLASPPRPRHRPPSATPLAKQRHHVIALETDCLDRPGAGCRPPGPCLVAQRRASS